MTTGRINQIDIHCTALTPKREKSAPTDSEIPRGSKESRANPLSRDALPLML